MNILIVASEAAPFASAGGLGDVVGSLPAALKELGCSVSVAMPAYRTALDRIKTWDVAVEGLSVAMGWGSVTGDILLGELAPGVPLYLVRCDSLFDREGIYGTPAGGYWDNPERYIFFSRIIPSLCASLSLHPDVILANDWQTGLVMALLNEGAVPGAAGVFAIHNMGYLGLVPPERTANIGLPAPYYRMEGLEFYGQMSLLKAGIVYAKSVVTVSPTYAREVQTPEAGFGLDGLMRSISGRLYGILNGVDYRVWDPSIDAHLVRTYSPTDLSGKAACKEDLLKVMGLPTGLKARPLAGMVSRLVEQKGSGILADACSALFSLGMGLVVLGSGDAAYEKALVDLQTRYPDRLGLKLGFDPGLAHKIMAGSDIFLIPSLYEPCGLTQLYSLKYGTIPVARATGGLKDTIVDPDEGRGGGTGFKFDRFHAADLVAAAARAIMAREHPPLWEGIQQNAMQQDFSWRRSAESYLRLFEQTASGNG
ncbi:MAG: glycogen synthase GlgA [Candidatus Desulfacyla sp.]